MSLSPEGTPWEAYFAKYSVGRAVVKADEDEAPEAVPIVVLEAGRELTEIEMRALKGTLGGMIKRLAGHAWEIRVGRSVAQNPAVLYATNSGDHNKGDVRYAAYVAEVFEVFAVKRADGGVLAAHSSWTAKGAESAKLTGARTYDPILGHEWRPRTSSSRPQLDWEKDEGVTPPMGLNQWFAIVAPTPAEIKKRQATKEAA